MKKEVFMKVGARHIGQLGRELVTDYVTALTELVKNSYDADAEAVQITFEQLKSNDGRIIIVDTGNGITSDDVLNKWAVIGTNSKVKDSYSPKYKRRFAGKKGIGRFAVERLAEYCTIISFTGTEKFRYVTNWNLYEGINIPEFIQRCEIVMATNDISSAKYIKCIVEYLLLTKQVIDVDKRIINKYLGEANPSFDMFISNALYVQGLKNIVIPIMEKYKDNEQMVQEIGNVITDEETDIINAAFDSLKHLYKTKEIDKKEITGTMIILDHLRDQWTRKDIEKIKKELLLLVAPSKSKDNNFGILISAQEYSDIENIELTNNVLDLCYAEVKGYFVEEVNEGLINKYFVVEYKDRSGKNEKYKDFIKTPLICGDFDMHLFYYVRDQKNLGVGTINNATIRKILDAFCGVKIYRDGFRVRPYGDAGNDWLLLDSKKIKDTHGYLVGNNQLIGEINVCQSNNPLLVDSTNREAIIENAAFLQLREYVSNTIKIIQNVRYEEHQKEEAKRVEEQELAEAEARKRAAKIDKSVKLLLAKAEVAAKSNDVALVVDSASQLAGVITEERKRSDELLETTKSTYQEQLIAKEREVSLYKNLASLGILAGTFGHETGDIFARIANDVGTVRDTCRFNGFFDDLEKCFGRLNRDINRVSSYSRLLLSFLKKDKREKPEILPMGTITKGLVDLYRKILESFNINLDIDEIENVDSPIKMYQIDYESIIVNLITNAFEAIKNKTDRKMKISVKNYVDNIRITVEDSGDGVTRDKMEWIFMPFNTTKKEDGVGLGLTIVKDLVDKYKGCIALETSKLGGAKFIIDFVIGDEND